MRSGMGNIKGTNCFLFGISLYSNCTMMRALQPVPIYRGTSFKNNYEVRQQPERSGTHGADEGGRITYR